MDREAQAGEDSGSPPTPVLPAPSRLSLARAARLLSHQGFESMVLASGSAFWGGSELFLGLHLSPAISEKNWKAGLKSV